MPQSGESERQEAAMSPVMLLLFSADIEQYTVTVLIDQTFPKHKMRHM